MTSTTPDTDTSLTLDQAYKILFDVGPTLFRIERLGRVVWRARRKDYRSNIVPFPAAA